MGFRRTNSGEIQNGLGRWKTSKIRRNPDFAIYIYRPPPPPPSLLSTYVGLSLSLSIYIYIYRSEGLPERDISSLGVMGWGLASAENSSAAVAVVAVAPWVGGLNREKCVFS